jgi:hypothetical protein
MRAFAATSPFYPLVLAGFGLVIVVSGCWVQKPMPTGHSSSSGGIRGLCTYEFACWQQGIHVAIVDDLVADGKGGSRADFYSHAGSKQDPHGARYEWRLDTADGKTATFRINDKEYDLTEGSLFVIRAQDDKVNVHQLRRDLSAISCHGAAIMQYLANDAELRKILGASELAK